MSGSFGRAMLATVSLAGAAALLPQAQAGEGGASNYPYGAISTYAALLPPPGTTALYNYVAQYSADRVVDGDGKRIPGVDVEFFAMAPRLVHTWKRQLAGFNMTSGVLMEFLDVSVDVPGASDDSTGATLAGIEPLYLTRAFGPLHVYTGAVIYFPAGTYDETRLANSTTGYFSWAYQFHTSWLPNPRWDASLAFAVEFKDRNKETGYHSGDQAGVTWGLSHRPFADARWELGLIGFYTEQIEDDEVNGQPLPGGGRTRKLALGPKLAYWAAPAKPVILQWHRESNVRNAPSGDIFWLEFAFPVF